jgi:hypothetical protein
MYSGWFQEARQKNPLLRSKTPSGIPQHTRPRGRGETSSPFCPKATNRKEFASATTSVVRRLRGPDLNPRVRGQALRKFRFDSSRQLWLCALSTELLLHLHQIARASPWHICVWTFTPDFVHQNRKQALSIPLFCAGRSYSQEKGRPIEDRIDRKGASRRSMMMLCEGGSSSV